MTIVTKTGDKGETGLFGGSRVSKADARMHAIGTVDELNAMIGMAIAEGNLSNGIHAELTRIQHELFAIGADLASIKNDQSKIHPSMTTALEHWITELESSLPAQQWFILPGGGKAAAFLHLARTVCRRAERWIVAASKENTINPEVIRYINRLSDCLFLLARAANKDEGIEDVRVKYE